MENSEKGMGEHRGRPNLLGIMGAGGRGTESKIRRVKREKRIQDELTRRKILDSGN